MFNRFLLSIIFFFVFTASYYSQNSTYTISLLDYLKPQYLGKKIRVKVPSGRYVLSKIINVTLDDDRYFVHFDRDIKLKCVFFTSYVKKAVNRQLDNKKMMLDVQSLKAQETINNVIKNTGKDSQLGFSSSSIQNLEKNMDKYLKKNNFTTTDKIIYTDHVSEKEVADLFIVDLDGLYLSDGTKIFIKFEGVD
ncbi:hypothetical protein DID78_05165 [Candidatus Marinamargulisbacteria bacterium SCGC AG-343-D04]|nr:hypothetical protein DID78_05165 [Candidatus Marinamargulisbacteria bacterium SCGC AG-343-D04]